MRRLFEEGLASPFDISYEEGRSALHFAVTAERPGMVRFLLDQHADPEAEDYNNLTANDVVWNYYLQNPGITFFEDFLSTIGLSRHETDSLYKRKFSVVHRIVLGLSNLDLDEYLITANEEIDRPDQSGKTPLCWAASRPNPSLVETLLRRGASLVIGDRRKQTPLHYCAGSGHAFSMEVMLRAARDGLDNTPLSRRSSLAGPVAFSTIINARDSKGRTPLNFATRMNFPIHAQLLISAGADVEAPDEPLRRTIMLTAIYWNSCKVLPLLLRSGARTDQYDAGKATILHYAARYASLETLRVLSQHDLGNIDTEARDDGGLIAVQTFKSSLNRVEWESEHNRTESDTLFAQILVRHQNRGGGNVVNVTEESDDGCVSDASVEDFYDASADFLDQ